MGIWIDLLTLGVTGQAPVARQKLALDLPLALRSFVASSRGGGNTWVSCPSRDAIQVQPFG